MKLAPKLSLAFIAGVSVVLAINGYFRVKREVALFESDRVRDNVLIGAALASAVESMWKTDGRDAALAMLTKAGAREARVRVRWVALDGNAAVSTDRAELLARPVGEPVTHVEASGESDDRRYTFLRLAVPDGPPGAIEVSESLAQEHAYVRETLESTVGTMLFLDGVCALLAIALGAWIVGRPMETLAAKARRIGQGDFSGPVTMTQRDEIAALGREMNAMCDRLVEANERVELETRSRIRALEQLRHADRLTTVGVLASGVAHEIGTPLNVVEARAAMIADGSMSPTESAEYAQVIVRSTAKITRIIRQLLAFARRETARKSRCDLVTLAQHTNELLVSFAVKRGVALHVEGARTGCFVDADSAQIEQVLTNLTMNAVQASEAGSKVEVSVDEALAAPPADLGGQEGVHARVRVRDHGRGIPEEHLAHIFEPFFTTKDVGEGTGLGLSIAYGIMRDHGGWITATSEPGHGAELTLYLPKAANP